MLLKLTEIVLTWHKKTKVPWSSRLVFLDRRRRMSFISSLRRERYKFSGAVLFYIYSQSSKKKCSSQKKKKLMEMNLGIFWVNYYLSHGILLVHSINNRARDAIIKFHSCWLLLLALITIWYFNRASATFSSRGQMNPWYGQFFFFWATFDPLW